MQKDISDLACRLSGAILSREIQAQDYDDMIKDFFEAAPTASSASEKEASHDANAAQ